MSIKTTLQEIIKRSIKDSYNIDFENIILKNNNGKYYTNIPLILSKELKLPPNEIANDLIKNINNNDIIEKKEIIDLGFINFSIKKEYLLNNINTILKDGKKYGSNNLGNKKRINIEIKNKDINLPISIKNLGKLIYIDNVSRIMNFCSYDVYKEYYVYSNDININEIKTTLDKYRINFDIYETEQSLYENYKIENTINKLRDSNYCYIDNNELLIKTTEFGDIKDRILIDINGDYTDYSKDITHYLNKYNEKYNKIINIVSSKDKDYINNIKIPLIILNKDENKLQSKILEQLKLTSNQNIILTDLIDASRINEIRYYLSYHNNIDNSLQPQNIINHIENTNIKITSILKKYRKVEINIKNYSTLTSSYTYNILNKLIEFNDIIINANNYLEPYILAKYVYELSLLFQEFYEKENIIADNQIYTYERLNLIKSIKIIINNTLNLLGIIPREEM